MQCVELHAPGIGRRDRVDVSKPCPQGRHFRGDTKLRDRRQKQHAGDQNVAEREGLRGSCGQARKQQRTAQEYHA